MEIIVKMACLILTLACQPSPAFAARMNNPLNKDELPEYDWMEVLVSSLATYPLIITDMDGFPDNTTMILEDE